MGASAASERSSMGLSQMLDRLSIRLGSASHQTSRETSRSEVSLRSVQRRLPSPALYSSPRAEEKDLRTTSMRYVLSDTGLHSGPWARTLGSKPFKAGTIDHFPMEPEEEAVERSGKTDPALPLEKPTAEVLDRIYPVRQKFPQETSKPKKRPSPKAKVVARINHHGSLLSTGDSSGSLSIPAQSLRRESSVLVEADSPSHMTPSRSKSSFLQGSLGGSPGVSPSGRSSDHLGGASRRFSSVAMELNRDIARMRLLQIRGIFLSRHDSLNMAFDELLGRSGGVYKEISRDGFSRLLKEHVPEIDKDDYNAIFNHLDINGNGAICMAEFQMACETALPVKKMEELRLKLIALGFSSMRQALDELEASTRRKLHESNTSKRLTFREFALACCCIGIITDDEHDTIYSALTESTESRTVTVAEMTAALCVLCPPLLLEHVRSRLHSKYASRKPLAKDDTSWIEEACNLLTPDDADTPFTCEVFVERAVKHLLVTPPEAAKLFRLIDIDGTESVGRLDVIRALRLAEPGLFMENARRNVRRRWRSIQEAFALHRHEVDTFGICQRPADEVDAQLLQKARRRGYKDCTEADFKTLPEIQSIVASVGLSESDTEALFLRLDVNGDKRMTSAEFEWGVRMCTPSGIMEEMRLQCVRSDAHVVPNASVRCVFDGVAPEIRSKVLRKDEFVQVVNELDIAAGISAERIYDLLDECRPKGGLVLDELIIALDTAALGSSVPLRPDQRAEKVRQQVNVHIGPILNNTKEHRYTVRKRVTHDTDTVPKKLPLGLASDPKGYFCSSLFWQKTYGNKPTPFRPASQARAAADMDMLEKASPRSPRIEIGSVTLGTAAIIQRDFPAVDLNAFNPAADLCKLPPSRQRPRPLEPPRWADVSHQKMTQLFGNRRYGCGEGGEVIMRNISDYYTIAGQTLAVDTQSLQESPVTRYQQFKAMRAAELAGSQFKG